MIKQLICVTILGSVVVQAQDFFYVGVNVENGMSGKHEVSEDFGRNRTLAKENIDSLFSSGIDIGFFMSTIGGRGSGTSFELSYNRLSIDNDNIDQFGIDLIGRFDNNLIFVPYLGGGLTFNNLKGTSDDDDGTGLRLRAGFYYDVIESLELGVEFNVHSIKWKTENNLDYDSFYYGVKCCFK